MITEVVKLGEGKFKLNDAVVIHNLDFDDEGVTFTIDYDENLLTESEAMEIAEEFINEAINSAIANAKA